MEKDNIKKSYEAPLIEVEVFSFEDSIATSGIGLDEEVWGG